MGGRGSGSKMGGGAKGPSAAASEGPASTSAVRFSNSEMNTAADNYWNEGWSNKRQAARILSGDLTEQKYVDDYVKSGLKSNSSMEERFRKTKAEYESEARESYNRNLQQAKEYAVHDTAKRLGIDTSWRDSESEARSKMGNSAYDALLSTVRESARRAIESHKKKKK